MGRDDIGVDAFSTYITLRYGMAVMAFAFPVLLWLDGNFHGISLQDSMSAYYHALPDDGAPLNDYFAPHSFFVGLLFAIGACLYLYKGFSKFENRLLNAAGFCAWGVALYPMPWHCTANCSRITPHYLFAVALFVCIAIVAVRCRNQTLRYLDDRNLRRAYEIKYWLVAAAMILSPLAAIILSVFFGQYSRHVFFVEAFGIWAFATYWWIKSGELERSEAEKFELAQMVRPSSLTDTVG